MSIPSLPDSPPEPGPARLWTEHETADYLLVAVRTLRKWRAEKRELRYLKLGPKLIRYDPADVRRYQQRCAREPRRRGSR